MNDLDFSFASSFVWIKKFFVCLDREYNLYLPRREVEEVDNLRDEWIKLMELAEKVSPMKHFVSFNIISYYFR